MSNSPITVGHRSLRSVPTWTFDHPLQRRDINPLDQLMMLKTNIPDQIRRSVNEESVSVIHAPESFRSWVGSMCETLVLLVFWTSLMRLTLVDLDGVNCRAGTAERKELPEGLKCYRDSG